MTDRFLAPTGNQTIQDFLLTTNMYAEGYLGIAIILIVWSLIFFSLKSFSTDKAAASASFITAILAVFLGILGILPDLFMWLCLILGLIAGTLLYVQK